MADNSDSGQDQKHISKSELIFFLLGVFFYTNMVSMVNNYRQAYLINVLKLENNSVSLINFICGIAGYCLSFIYAIIMDRTRSPIGKFRPLGMASAVPIGVVSVLMFFTPKMPLPLTIAYLSLSSILFGTLTYFGNSINMVAVVMTPNTRERDKVMTLRSIVSAVGSAAPLVVVLVVGMLRKPGIIKTEQMMYLVSSTVCAVAGASFLLVGMKAVRERITYSRKKDNPLSGFKDIIKNKYATLVFISELIKGLRGLGSYMGIFLAAILLGDTSKYIFFGLPTGIGTFVGMMAVKALLKKFNNKQIYIASGIYSLLINCIAFGAGIIFFNRPDSVIIKIFFFACLFLIGLQFGASNLLPSLFQADILEDLEVKHRKRLDASLAFVIGTGTTLSALIVSTVAPLVLYGGGSIIQYKPPVEEIIDGVLKTVYQAQTYATKVKMLGFYTVWHGLMMLLGAVPFFLYKLVGKERERVHNEALNLRKEFEKE